MMAIPTTQMISVPGLRAFDHTTGTLSFSFDRDEKLVEYLAHLFFEEGYNCLEKVRELIYSLGFTENTDSVYGVEHVLIEFAPVDLEDMFPVDEQRVAFEKILTFGPTFNWTKLGDTGVRKYVYQCTDAQINKGRARIILHFDLAGISSTLVGRAPEEISSVVEMGLATKLTFADQSKPSTFLLPSQYLDRCILDCEQTIDKYNDMTRHLLGRKFASMKILPWCDKHYGTTSTSLHFIAVEISYS